MNLEQALKTPTEFIDREGKKLFILKERVVITLKGNEDFFIYGEGSPERIREKDAIVNQMPSESTHYYISSEKSLHNKTILLEVTYLNRGQNP